LKTVLLLLFVCALTGGCNFSASTGTNKSQHVATTGSETQNLGAFEAAKEIVHSIDDGQYEQVWENSSQLLKNMTPKFALTNMLSLTRKNLGAPSPRGAPAIGFAEKIDDNVPKGEFSIVEIDTTFGQKVVHEKIVMVKEDGAWKLAGYFINGPL
jgi:hypothetical protein